MGHFFSKSVDTPVAEVQIPVHEVVNDVHPSNLLAQLDALLKALHHLEVLKMAIESEIHSEHLLMASNFEAMNSARLKLNLEIECIQSETEQQIIKYKTKAKLFI